MPDVELGEPEGRWLKPGTLAYIRGSSFLADHPVPRLRHQP